MTMPSVNAGIFGSGLFNRQASDISEKRVKLKTWQSEKQSKLLDKKFTMTEWGKHFSSLGSKRSNISLQESKNKKLFKTETKTYATKIYEMSQWNERMAALQKQARISTDDIVKDITEKQLYGMMLQDAEKYADMGEELSLRDLNRFQFRHNRSAGAVPVETVGTEE
jgi:hypothetical protein